MERGLARAVALLLLSLAVGLPGCVSPTDPLGREDALEDAQQRYTDLVPRGELEKAGTFVDPELRDEFLALAEDYAALRITDFEIQEIQYGDPGTRDASVTVVYKGYLVSTLIERTAREEQAWYREEGLRNQWRVRPQLAQVLATLRGAAPERAGF